MNPAYLATARLLAQVAPLVFADDRFALKGGTAINLFLRDLPRLSVDLDLVFVDHHPDRVLAMMQIEDAVRGMADRLQKRGFDARVGQARGGEETRLFVRRGGSAVKVEINHVMRGTVLPVASGRLAPGARTALQADAEIPLLASDEIYGGKLVAALDRQHPRDLYDVLQLHAHGGVTPGIRRAFVAYLACHGRPMHEVLFAGEKNVDDEFSRHFVGMTAEPVGLDELLAVRTRLFAELPAALDADERAFLISLAHGEPEWDRLGFDSLRDLPAAKWKLQNLQQLQKENPAKFGVQARELVDRLKPTA